MRFQGTAEYVATPDLTGAANARIPLQRPSLVEREPEAGRTELARIVGARFSDPKPRLAHGPLEHSSATREAPGSTKRPPASEVPDWFKLFLAEGPFFEGLGAHPTSARRRPHDALPANWQDVHFFERFALVARSRLP